MSQRHVASVITGGYDGGVNETSATTTRTCHFCAATIETGGINANHWIANPDEEHGGHWNPERINVCASPACRNQIARPPRRKRQPRQPVRIDAGGWFAAAQLNAALNRKA